MLKAKIGLCLLVLLSAVAWADDPTWIARGRNGMVASDSPEASQVGAGVLSSGGNAFDAAVATSFALGVARPYSTGLGGGGFMVAYIAKEQRFVALDFREMAPAGATPEHYAEVMRDADKGPPPSIFGGNAIGVPGQLAGLVEINQHYGTQSLAELTKPAIALARSGVAVDANFREACRHIAESYDKWAKLRAFHPQLGEMFLKNGQPPQIGERIARPAYAKALTVIAEAGREAVYGGPLGRAMVQAARKAGSPITADDLAGYRVKTRTPVRGTYRGFEVVSMPPPSSGGVALIEALNILEARRAALADEPSPAAQMHLRIEAMKHAFADRARFLGDPDFADVPSDYLVSKAYAKTLAARVELEHTAAADTYGVAQIPDDDGTSHFCVADAHGNVVAITETINGKFGSFVVAEPFGIILNNEMDDFVTARGQANLYGLVQSDANLVGPGKRPLSSMSPTIVMKDDKPVLVLGASGGPRIISSVLHVMLNVLDINLPLADALASVRAHHQWQPNEVFFDRDAAAGAQALSALGHTIGAEHRSGIVQAIRFLEDGTMVGGSDPRKGGRPAAP